MSHYKPYPAYKDSEIEWIGKVPEHWDVMRLRHVAAFKNSNVDKKAYDGQEAVSLCNYTDVYYNEFITPNLPFMQATASPAEIEQFTLKKGDVIITKDSEDPSDIGIPSLVKEEVPGVVCGYHLTMIRGADFDTARLLHRILQSHPTQAHFFVEAPGITRYGLSQDAIGDLRFCLPPADERAAIADRIDRETARIDALIANKTEFIGLLTKKRQALITHAVTKGLNPKAKMKDSGVEWIGKVPEHWDVAPIKRWFSTTSGATPDTEQQAKYYADADGSGVPWIRTTDLSNGPVTTFAIGITQQAIEDTACKLIPKKSVLVAMYGGDGTIGKNGLLEISACINQAICALLPNERFVPEYTFAYIQHYRPYWMVYAASTRKDPNISQEIIREAPIVCPPVKEQQQVAAFLKTSLARLDVITAKTQLSIDLLKKRRSALITAAVTGQIDLRESA